MRTVDADSPNSNFSVERNQTWDSEYRVSFGTVYGAGDEGQGRFPSHGLAAARVENGEGPGGRGAGMRELVVARSAAGGARFPKPKAERGVFGRGAGGIAVPPPPSSRTKVGVFSFHSAAAARPASGDLLLGKSRGERRERRRLSFEAFGWRWDDEEPLAVGTGASFGQGVALFNEGEYYKCHDVLEEAWNEAQEPQRSILHGVLQCSVGMYHLLNQNHKGAMIELGEGLNKLKRVCNRDGPLEEFQRSMSLLLEFIFQTQMEFAACAEDMCITLDGSEQSYSLLGNYGAGQALYTLQRDEQNRLFLVYSNAKLGTQSGDQDYGKIEVPVLRASEEDFLQYQ